MRTALSSDDRLHFEDLKVGDSFSTPGTLEVTRDAIVDFASQWDPRPHHIDEDAAKDSAFGGLVASGVHAIAICIRESVRVGEQSTPQAVLAGLGSENRLLEPIRAGDNLAYRAEIVEKRASRSRPGAGIVRTRHELVNQHGVTAFEMTTASLVAGRTPQETTWKSGS